MQWKALAMTTRTETDSIGAIEVASDRYWGAQTERSRNNFKIGGDRQPLPLIHALATIKKAAARVSAKKGKLPNEIAEAIEPIRAELAAIPEERRWLVSSEGAFSYLAKDFGLKELYLWPINADAQGTPQQVRAVIDEMSANDIPCIFSESTVSSKPAEQVARETGATYGGVLYVDSLSDADGPVPTYIDLLKVTADTIAECLVP